METLLDLKNQYRGRFGSDVDYREAIWGILTSEFFQKFVDENSVVLDLGAGWGEFTRNIRASKKFAMDLNPDCSVHLGRSADVLVQNCADHWNLPDDSLDVVFTSNFFEHLPDKDALRRTLLEAARCLKPGGRIICMGPNIRLIPGAYWDFWDHYLPLTDRCVSEILRLSGFRVALQLPAFLPYSMSQGWKPPLFLLRCYLKMQFLWRIFGKQFLLIATIDK